MTNDQQIPTIGDRLVRRIADLTAEYEVKVVQRDDIIDQYRQASAHQQARIEELEAEVESLRGEGDKGTDEDPEPPTPIKKAASRRRSSS